MKKGPLLTPICTCNRSDKMFDHATWCELWDDDDFTNGIVMWSSAENRLVSASEDAVNEYLQNGEPEESEFDFLDAPAFKSDHFLECIMDAEERGLVQFNWSGVNLHRDDAASTNWKVRELGCYCDPPQTERCKTCDVVHIYASWHQVHWVEGEVLCTCKEAHGWTCTTCEVTRTNKTTPFDKIKTWTSSGKGYSQGQFYDPHATHCMQEVTFPDDVKVYCSTSYSNKKGATVPDFGFYFADTWTPRSVAMMVPWTDHGLPQVPDEWVDSAIKLVWNLAVQGNTVELGCIGAHGRTGTVLACFAVLAGIPPEDAVAWVRKNYCTKAVEAASQEWFVLAFHARLHGLPVPEKPKPAPVGGSIATSKTQNIGKTCKVGSDTLCSLCGGKAFGNDTTCYYCGADIVRGTDLTYWHPPKSPPKSKKAKTVGEIEHTCEHCGKAIVWVTEHNLSRWVHKENHRYGRHECPFKDTRAARRWRKEQDKQKKKG